MFYWAYNPSFFDLNFEMIGYDVTEYTIIAILILITIIFHSLIKSGIIGRYRLD